MRSERAKPARSAKFLFLMDPYETLDLTTETSLLLMQELMRRGHRAYWMQQEDLALDHHRPVGLVSRVISTAPLERGQPVLSSLNRFDAVLVRKDPPFDTQYLQITLILDHLDPGVLQVNEVRALREFNEKMLPLRWPHFAPPTLISMNADQLRGFAEEHRSVVLKPLNDCSGRGIERLDGDDEPGRSRRQIEAAVKDPDGRPRFVLAQKFLENVRQGDKRVYLVDGEPLGMVNRIPAPGSFLANIHQGATCEATRLSAREDHIIRTIAPFLREQGIMLAGADFIGGYLTELNITSPSAIRQINEVSGESVHARVVDALLEKLAPGSPSDVDRRAGRAPSSTRSGVRPDTGALRCHCVRRAQQDVLEPCDRRLFFAACAPECCRDFLSPQRLGGA